METTFPNAAPSASISQFPPFAKSIAPYQRDHSEDPAQRMASSSSPSYQHLYSGFSHSGGQHSDIDGNRIFQADVGGHPFNLFTQLPDVMDFRVEGAVDQRSQSTAPTLLPARDSNWQDARADIKRHYIDEAKTLEETMRLITDRYGFEARQANPCLLIK